MAALPHRLRVLAVLSFVAVAIVQTWPLALHFSTAVTGDPGGDTGAYLWNIWHFRHRLVDLGKSPFWTDGIFALTGATNLALHNYTVFADLIALPLQSFAGVVTAFNAAYVTNVALAGLGMFLLAQRVTGRTAEAWLAGFLFAWAPFLVARGTSHFSLVAAAPLPFFLYAWDRAWSSGRWRDAMAAGASVAWGFYCDPYYAVYAALLLAVHVASHTVTCRRADRTPALNAAARVLDAIVAAILLAIIAVYAAGGGALQFGGVTITLHTLYNPMLAVAVLLAARAALSVRLGLRRPGLPARLVPLIAVLAGSAAILLLPELHALGVLAVSDRIVTAPVLWRSSAPGVDAIAFFIPNPSHPLMPDWVRAWIARQPGGFEENVVSLSYVAAVVIGVAWRRAGFKPAVMWTAVTLGFASFAVGPFLNVAGVHTFFPTPWAFARYLPLVGEARMPPRFGVLVCLGFAVLFASALAAIGRRWPDNRRVVLGVVGLALAVELVPAPRPLFAAGIPGVFQMIAADARPLRVLELPFGVRDGLSSLGDFSASSEFYQTAHGKDLIGGYLSRVDETTKRVYLDEPFTRALMDFGEKRTPPPDRLAAAEASAASFVDRARLGYVVVDGGRVTAAERDFVVRALGLTRLDTPAEHGPRELYATRLALAPSR